MARLSSIGQSRGWVFTTSDFGNAAVDSKGLTVVETAKIAENRGPVVKVGLRAKVPFVHWPGLLLGNAVLLVLLLLTFNFSLGSLLLVHPDPFDDSRPGHASQRFRNNKHSESRLVRGTEE